ncbi:M20/M25/M40 family metallo-hydrolase [Flavihumibacter rivuli]|uniref:M20/M25/M40 family metallo-hydrolase n=1 Tax=Flavihumibacter rivuli TaxID=2838156 RepID=UPI001BDE6650|nr:M20/M25/M40 family metallo-hydrolase [Flavihumibacter rivuli]ULQ55729.1 M20/M25/M40 family metallo-hydrolase [Flavihumibacter rivuli]
MKPFFMHPFEKAALTAALLLTQMGYAQKLKKSDKQVIQQLQAHVNYLADDKLEGRRAGSRGEELARNYISKQFAEIGLTPKGADNSWFQAFSIYDGLEYKGNSYLFIEGNEIKDKDFFPMALSPEKILEAMPSVALKESGQPWFMDLAAEKQANSGNPHFDLDAHLQAKIKEYASKGATALLIYNIGEDIKFNPKQKGDQLPIPVLCLSDAIAKKYLVDETAMVEVKLKTGFKKNERQGHNVVGYLDNGAARTVIIGAHYDHLGFGEDGNSMLRNGERLIHNGADDNASGTSTLIELARSLKKDKQKNTNYLFLAFSGEELGLFGSKYFAENPTIALNTVNYMINMDMVGRLNDSSKSITVGGIGTSPSWGSIFNSVSDARYFNIKYDSSGTGPSDHTSFYRKDLPVLFFFTGLHTDYHKPSDDAEKVNVTGQLQILKLVQGVIKQANEQEKLVFTKTREQQTTTSARFSVSMGIMPDYSFSGNGVKVDGVTDGRPASKAGVKTGDIIVQLGTYPVSSVEQYMQALGKFRKGDKTTVKYKRGESELEGNIEF